MNATTLWFIQEITPAIFGVLFIMASFLAGFFIGKLKTENRYLKKFIIKKILNKARLKK